MTSVSFTSGRPSIRNDDTDDDFASVKISINPSQQTFLLPSPPPSHALLGSFSLSQEQSCFLCPVLFERASKSWWNPKFDSNILEEQYHKSTFPQICQRFQYALIYIFLVSVSYCIYFGCMAKSYWIYFVIGSFSLMCYTIAVLLFTYTSYYQNFYIPVSLCTTIILCALSLLIFIVYINNNSDFSNIDDDDDLSSVGLFCMCIVILLILYTVIPLPLYICILIGGSYSIIFEILTAFLTPYNSALIVIVKILLQICIHMMGIQILLLTEVRMRNTLLKVGQSLIVRRDLEIEKQLKEKIIHSIMPPKVSDWLMATQEGDDDDQIDSPSSDRRISSSPRQSQMIFRPFNMHCMDNVSILFADIVGFTKMSSNKTAEQLVGLLNDLFGRFDYLCAKLGCEKISTLGDCYYCVSGCPEPQPDHAKCCVEMGLGMIKAIGEFDEDTNEDVNMRVGVHTGTVLCGIVGTCRFKFDVWSNDVTYANLMESSGKPGRVHISESTYSFLHDQYTVEEGLPFQGKKTYFIRGRKYAMYERVATAVAARHSWPFPPTVIAELQSRKPSSQSETGQAIDEDGSDAPMLPLHFQGSFSTLSSSRKDSGIRSRRSSLQDMIFDTTGITTANLLSHRFSGYYASSQTSVADTGRSSGSSVRGASLFVDPSLSLNESLVRLKYIRKQSDLQLIRCVQQDVAHVDYFVRPPINRLSLFFHDRNMENEYRRRINRRDRKGSPLTVSSAKFNTYFAIFLSTFFYVVIAFSCFLLFDITISWFVFCFLATGWQLFIIILCLQNITFSICCTNRFLSQAYNFFTSWYPWHVCGAILLSLPVVSVFCNFTCTSILTSPERIYTFCYLIFVSLIHFCNFTQLNYWLKSILCIISGVILILLLGTSVCPCDNVFSLDTSSLLNNITVNKINKNIVPFSSPQILYHCNQSLVYEIILNIAIISCLVWFLNREFEISYRLSFHGGMTAARDKRKIQIMKNQADWLLHNIIPKHVVEQLKTTSKYSENHKNAGIIFASIVNFHEMYDESFEGGKEYLRVLNELVGDFDELLQRPSFKNIEKIKTIGSTFMAASGLNPKIRQENPHPHTHLIELLDFAISMQQVIEHFNCNLLEFSFIMRIGYNFGDVTAGVIGTTKLYYDIWGDAVNIASRMDSHGVSGRIQLPEHCVPVLEQVFEFEHRGSIFVKGKDHMNVFLLVKKHENIPEIYKPISEEPVSKESESS